ncbi:nucleotidyltransferase/DNA polymerase [Bacillus sp. OxB-1]|uniref:DNA polymerase IV n=1 Tax=Bacillus sp. (strain OxB-1) TaxID=98228 RepID=UPI000581F5A9|nr:DNA polymerase IV [Bacillus sp. OxB-1]BAQ11191.1 nucleotidyltransferase/DNA polymerase [Bacillus sp. OxB-1]
MATDGNPRGKGGPRVILHLDMNSFFASVEQAHDPSLKGIPMAVAGSPKERRGILVTCSYEARALGIYTTMTVGEAKRICPTLVIVPPDFEKYRTASAAVFAILRSYTDLVEPVSIDEAYIDITDIGGLTDAVSIAANMQQRILGELDLPCSIGIAPNKFLAKTASDMKKPLGITILRKREIADVLWPLPVIEMHGIGKSTEKKLHELGIRTIGDLAACEELLLKQSLGKNGLRLRKRANGIDSRPVDPEAAEDRKSVGSSTTLAIDETDLAACLQTFRWLAEKVANRLAKSELTGSVVMIQIRTADWRNHSRSRSLVNPIYQADDIYAEAADLFQKNWSGDPVRLLGITVSNVIPIQELHEQLSIYNFEEHSKDVEMNELVARLEKKFGDGTVKRGTR